MPKPPILYGVQPEELDKYWPLVERQLVSELEYADGKFNLKSIKDGLKLTELQLWVVKQGDEISMSVVTQLVNYPAKKVMLILFLGGENFDEFKHLASMIFEFAEYWECESVEIYGRTGWKKKLKDLGFLQIHSVYRLPLKMEIGKNEKNLH